MRLVGKGAAGKGAAASHQCCPGASELSSTSSSQNQHFSEQLLPLTPISPHRGRLQPCASSPPSSPSCSTSILALPSRPQDSWIRPLLFCCRCLPPPSTLPHNSALASAPRSSTMLHAGTIAWPLRRYQSRSLTGYGCLA